MSSNLEVSVLDTYVFQMNVKLTTIDVDEELM